MLTDSKIVNNNENTSPYQPLNNRETYGFRKIPPSPGYLYNPYTMLTLIEGGM